MSIEFLIISFIVVPLGVAVGIGILIARIFRRKNITSNSNSNSNLNVYFSKEDILSQLFFFLSICFMTITAMAFNQKLGSILEWPLIILLASFVCIFLSYRFKGVLLLPVGLIGLFYWWFIKSSEWIDQGNNATDIKDLVLFSLPLVFSLFLYVVGLIHERNRKFERYVAVYNVLPTIAVTATLFLVSMEFGIETLLEMTEGVDLFSSWQITISYVFGGLVFISSIFYSFWKKCIKPIEGMVLLMYGIIFGLSVFLPDISEKDLELHFAAFVNIFLLAHLIILLFAGYLKKKSWLINLGSFSLFIFIIIKYFDWAFDFLDKSVFFISAGILLLVLGWFMERGRRYVISSSQTII